MNNRAVMSAQSQAAMPTTTNTVMSVMDLQDRLRRMLEVQKNVMKEGIHYGKIPGCNKDSLYQPGAQILSVTFKVGTRPSNIESDSDTTRVHYRVTLEAFDQVTGLVLGYGVGECSSDEDKYAWRESICDEEFDSTPDQLKRIKYKRGKNNSHYTVKQISTNPADVANTVLKMAKKRALINVTLDVLAASEIFTQDIEDLPEGYDFGDEDAPGTKPPVQPVKSKSAGSNQGQPPSGDDDIKKPTEEERTAQKLISEKQGYFLIGKCKKQGVEHRDIAAHLKIPSVFYITWQKSVKTNFEAVMKTVDEKPEFFAKKAPATPANTAPAQTQTPIDLEGYGETAEVVEIKKLAVDAGVKSMEDLNGIIQIEFGFNDVDSVTEDQIEQVKQHFKDMKK